MVLGLQVSAAIPAESLLAIIKCCTLYLDLKRSLQYTIVASELLE